MDLEILCSVKIEFLASDIPAVSLIDYPTVTSLVHLCLEWADLSDLGVFYDRDKGEAIFERAGEDPGYEYKTLLDLEYDHESKN